MAVSGTITGVRISGIACAVPETVVGNEVFAARFGGEQMAKFEKMVGVKERRISTVDQTASDFAFTSAQKLKAAGRWSEDDVDGIVFVSQSPDYVLPATACVLQKRLGVKTGCLAFDVNLGCSGFVYGLFIASSLLKMDGVRKVLLLGGDCSSKLVSPRDPSSAPLFGDAGFAVVLERDDMASPLQYAYCTDGNGFNAIVAPGLMMAGRHPVVYSAQGDERHIPFPLKDGDASSPVLYSDLHMDGMDVFNFTINEVPDLIKAELARAGLTSEMVDCFVLHQANRFVLKQVAMALGSSMKKVPVSMDRYGNTSVSSIPLTLCDYNERGAELGEKTVLMSGFGVGLSWGTLLGKFDFTVCEPITHGTDHFDDGIL